MLTLRLWFLAAWGMVGVDSQPIELQSLFLKDCGPAALTQKPLTTYVLPVFSASVPAEGNGVGQSAHGEFCGQSRGPWY